MTGECRDLKTLLPCPLALLGVTYSLSPETSWAGLPDLARKNTGHPGRNYFFFKYKHIPCNILNLMILHKTLIII